MAQKNSLQLPGDYIDVETGLLVCGKCQTAKTTKIEFFGEERTVPCLCSCMVAQEKAREQQKNIDIKRDICFGCESRKRNFTFELDDSQNEFVSKIAHGYVAHFPEMIRKGKGLLFLGPPGTGKTFTACCIANAVIDMGYSARVTTFADLANELQSTEDKIGICRTLNKYDLLILDDLGAERNTSFMDEIVFSVIDRRSSKGKPLIITSNLSAREFANPLTDHQRRIFSRLYDLCLPVEVTGQDRRQEQLKSTVHSELARLME